MAKKTHIDPDQDINIMADVDAAANGRGLYRVYRRTKSVRGKPPGRKLIAAGMFDTRDQAIEFGAKEYARILVSKMEVIKES